jgi:hypothetical protein
VLSGSHALLVWRVKLVAELRPGEMREIEVAAAWRPALFLPSPVVFQVPSTISLTRHKRMIPSVGDEPNR